MAPLKGTWNGISVMPAGKKKNYCAEICIRQSGRSSCWLVRRSVGNATTKMYGFERRNGLRCHQKRLIALQHFSLLV